MSSEKFSVTTTINGVTRQEEVDVRKSLGDFLRDDLELTGTHIGCEHGVCGACTVLVDGVPVRSCLMLAPQADQRDIRTVEGLCEDDGGLSVLQWAFREKHALQCGFCTPGILTTMTAFLKETPDPDEDAVRKALSGTICRCTGYQNIVAAVLLAARVGADATVKWDPELMAQSAEAVVPAEVGA